MTTICDVLKKFWCLFFVSLCYWRNEIELKPVEVHRCINHPRLFHPPVNDLSIPFPCSFLLSHPTPSTPSGASHTTTRARVNSYCSIARGRKTGNDFTQRRLRLKRDTFVRYSSRNIGEKYGIDAQRVLFLAKHWVNGSTVELDLRTDYQWEKLLSTLTVFLERGFGFCARLPRILWL